MSPKSLLRDRRCRSSLDEMAEGTFFKRVIPEEGVATQNGEQVKKLVFCTGKIYYDIRDKRDEQNLSSDIAVARIEQVREPSMEYVFGYHLFLINYEGSTADKSLVICKILGF